MKEKSIIIKISSDSITYTTNFFREESNGEIPPFMLDNDDLNIRIIKIFHKILNTALPGKSTQIFDSDNFKTLGATLHKILLNFQKDNINFKSIHDNILNNKEDERCRIVLEFDSKVDGLAELPWEYLSQGKEFLFAYRDTKFELIRKINETGNKRIAEFQNPSSHLNVILIIVNPKVGQLRIDTKIIYDFFDGLKKKYGDKINILNFPEDVNYSNFHETLLQQIKILRSSPQSAKEPYIIHFYGHACEVKDGKSCLVFPPADDNSTEPEYISDDAFEINFSGTDLPALVVLQACSSGKILNFKEEQGIALRLSAHRSIPAVLSMQNDITPVDSTAFMKVFYEKILEGHEVSTAVREGRIYMGNDYQKGKPYQDNFFGSPVLMSIKDTTPILIKVEEKLPIKEEINSNSTNNSNTSRVCINGLRRMGGNPNCRKPVPESVNFCIYCHGEVFRTVPSNYNDIIEDVQLPPNTPTIPIGESNISGESITDNSKEETNQPKSRSLEQSQETLRPIQKTDNDISKLK